MELEEFDDEVESDPATSEGSTATAIMTSAQIGSNKKYRSTVTHFGLPLFCRPAHGCIRIRHTFISSNLCFRWAKWWGSWWMAISWLCVSACEIVCWRDIWWS